MQCVFKFVKVIIQNIVNPDRRTVKTTFLMTSPLRQHLRSDILIHGHSYIIF